MTNPTTPTVPSVPKKSLAAVKKQLALTLLLVLTLASMLLSWFGGARGVQEIRGTVVLFHPVTLLCAAVLLLEIWRPASSAKALPGVLAILGMMGVELYYFLFWHYETISGRISLSYSFHSVYPEFYLGFGLTAALLVLFLLWNRQPEETAFRDGGGKRQGDGPAARPV